MCLDVTASSLGVAIECPCFRGKRLQDGGDTIVLGAFFLAGKCGAHHVLFGNLIKFSPTVYLHTKDCSLKAHFAFACRRCILTMTSADVRDMLDLPTGDGHPRPTKKQKVVEKRPGSAMPDLINEHC